MKLPEMWPFKPEPFGIIDWIEGLKMLPAGSIDTVVTSPPYWNLRDYGVDGQLGLEPTMAEYIENLCNGFDEIYRVLKDTGSCWVNLGDTYNGSGGSGDPRYKKELNLGKNWREAHGGYPRKSLCLIPHRFAIEMIDRGWILRNTIIWYKPNCMPSSVKDRFTVDYEYMFFFVKKRKYFFEQQFEPASETELKRRTREKQQGLKSTYGLKVDKHQQAHTPSPSSGCRKNMPTDDYFEKGKNKRSVWKISPKPTPEAHFATFPEELVETPIKAGCPEFICKKCGKPREQIFKKIGTEKTPPIGGVKKAGGFNPTYSGNTEIAIMEFDKWSDCGCNAGWSPGVCLDPFLGSGTTMKVARYLRRICVGFELNTEYAPLIRSKVNLSQKDLEDF